MILSFFFLTFYDFEIKNDCFDYLGNTIYTNTRTPLFSKSNFDSWYFIQFSILNKINCREKLSKENGIFLDTDSLITSNICLAFLNSDNISSIQSYYKAKRENILIQPLENHQKLHNNKLNSENDSNTREYNYIARFHKSFTPPDELAKNLIKLSDEIYLYKISNQPKTNQDEALNKILSIPSLRSISSQNPTKLMNRWNSGFIQKNEWPGGYDIYNKNLSSSEIYSNGDLRVNRYFNDKGLNGTGQIITIVDSGLDINSPYFTDNSNKPFEYEKVDMNRRKVVYYTCYGNDHDSHDMHGTHVAGISSGSPAFSEETTSGSFEHQKLTLYNGVAPGSKVSIIDITENDESGTNVLNFPSILLGEAMGRVNSKIALCGWGNPSNTEQSYYYDLLAQFNPSRLFVFAAGNRGPGYQTVTTPGDGKNVLTVGALDSIFTSKYENEREYFLTVSTSSSSSEKVEHTLNLLTYGRDLFYLPSSSSKFMIENCRAVSSPTSTEQGEKVLVTSSSNFCTMLEQISSSSSSFSAAVFIGEGYDESLCPNEPKFSFPVFTANDTEILSYEAVSIRVGLPDEERSIPSLSVAQYSSRGPNYVGIQKPDVVAPGTAVFSADSNFVSASSGTSNAAAYVAGAAALVYEYFERGFYPTGAEVSNNSFMPTSDLVRAVIVASADPIPNNDDDDEQNQEEGGSRKRRRGCRTPNSLSGHGVVNLASFVSFSPHMKVFNSIKAGSDQHFFMRFQIKAEQLNHQKQQGEEKESLDLRIACAYKDPSSTNNYLALQTNIDMYLVLPNGTIVHGNHRPEDIEERFSTVERILIYEEELVSLAANKSSSGIFELHFVTGSGFSNLPHFGYFSLAMSGPFINDDQTSENATKTYDASTFSEELIELPDKLFTFIASHKQTCEFPSYGVLCQHNATEIGLNATQFDLYSNIAKLVFIKIPLNYTRIVLHLRREPSFSGRLALQFAINAIHEYGTNYPFIVSLNGGSSAIGLSRSMFGANEFVGIRISNMVGTDLKMTASITYEVAIPNPTPTQSPAATMPKNVIIHLSVSYGLFGLFLIPTIVFSVLICWVSKKIKNNRQVRRNGNNDRTITEESNNEITNELLQDNPL